MLEPKSFFPILANMHSKNTESIFSDSCVRRRLETIFVWVVLILALFPYPCALAQEKTKLLLTEDKKGYGRDIDSVWRLEEISRMNELAHLIRYYDEVLTQSARNYAFTRNKKWVQRYQDTEPKLTKVLEEAIPKEDLENKRLLESIDTANRKLLEMESRSIQLVDSGQIQQALAILEGAQYLAQKEIYNQSLNDYVKRLSETLSMAVPDYPTVHYTEEEKAWLAEHPVIELHTDDISAPYQFLGEDGQPTGIVVDYAEAIEKRLGIKINVICKPNRKIIENLPKGEYLLEGFYHDSGVQETWPYLKSKSVVKGYLSLFSRQADAWDINPGNLQGTTIAIMEPLSNELEPQLRQNNRILNINSIEEGLGALLNNRADYLLDFAEVVKFNLIKSQLTGIKEVYTFPVPDLGLFLVRNDAPLLLSSLNKAIIDIEHKELPAILSKWYGRTVREPVIKWTAEEKAWLKEHPVIRVGADPDWAPIMFRDEQGEHRGVTVDYLEKISELTGVQFKLLKHRSWYEAVEKVKLRQSDVLVNAAVSATRKEFAVFTRPYLNLPAVIFTRDDVAYISSLEELRGKQVATVRGFAAAEYVRNQWPDIELVESTSIAEALRKLNSGEVFAYIGTILVTSRYIREADLSHLKVSGETPFTYRLAMAVRSDWPILAGIIQKGLDAVSEEERNAIYRNWVAVIYEHEFDYSLLWKIITPVLLIAFIISFRNWRRARSEIAERKLAEEKMRKSEAQYRGLVVNIPGVVYRCANDPEWTIEFISDEIVTVSGYPASDFFKNNIRSMASIIYPDDHQMVYDNIQKALALKQPFTLEYRILHKDGSIKWVYEKGQGIHNQNGEVLWLDGVIVDITQRKKLEITLRESEKRYSSFFETARDGAFISRTDGRILDCNQGLAELFGFKNESELMKVNAQELYANPEERRRLIQEIIKNGFIAHLPMTGRKKDGSIRSLLMTAAAMKDEEGNVFAFQGTITDITERKQAEEELRQSENKFKVLFNQSIQFTGLLAPDGTMLAANQTALAFVDHDESALIGKPFWETPWWTHSRQEQERLQEAIKKVARGESIRYEATHLFPDGTLHYFDFSLKPVLDDSGNVTMLITEGRDITERKKAEEQMRLTQFSVDNAADTVFGIHTDAKIFFVNDTACKRLGYTREEMLNMHVWDFDPVYTREIWPQHRNEITQKGSMTFESQHKTKRGEVFPVEITTNLLNYDGQRYHFCFAKDITERKNAEVALQKERDFSNTLIQSSPTFFVAIGGDGRVIMMNDFMLETLGYTLDEVKDKDYLSTFVSQSDRPGLKEQFETLSKRFISTFNENKILTKDGRELLTEWHGRSLCNDNGELDFFFGVGMDITERKKAEAELVRYREHLEELVKQRTEELAQTNKDLEGFSYSVSHDLRAPLRHISGYINLLSRQSSLKDEEKRRHYMDMILDSSRKMGQLIDDLLVFSRLGRSQLHKEPVNLNELIEDIMRTRKSEIQGRTINWTVAELPQVSGDKHTLRVVMDNLISNALKYTRRETVAEIEIGCRDGEENHTVISIRDNGVGFNMAYVHKLFGVFQRLHSDEEFEGTGIGLATVQRIIQRHGGTVWAESVEGEGATFYFSL